MHRPSFAAALASMVLLGSGAPILDPPMVRARANVVGQIWGGGSTVWSRRRYPGKPTTVAAEKRKARKRRNRLRHKARCRGKRA